jgi:sec-independent protein translocase protein TatA
MFGLGTGELVIIFVAFFFLFGAKRLPELGQGLGQGLRSFKEALKNAQHKADDEQDKEK